MRLPITPLSDCYGYDRGTPIDRHYIEAFLAGHKTAIGGDGAEVKDDTYLRRFGEDRLRSATVIDIDPANPHATLHADLAAARSLPAAAFDCIVLTQTLQLVGDPATAVANCHQALRPGGTLLITVPTLGRISRSNPGADRWRLSPAGLRHLLAQWPGQTTVTGYGNLRTCLAALLAEAAEELTRAELGHPDPAFPLVACAAARR